MRCQRLRERAALIVAQPRGRNRLEEMYMNVAAPDAEGSLRMTSRVPWTMVGTIGAPEAMASTNGPFLNGRRG